MCNVNLLRLTSRTLAHCTVWQQRQVTGSCHNQIHACNLMRKSPRYAVFHTATYKWKFLRRENAQRLDKVDGCQTLTWYTTKQVLKNVHASNNVEATLTNATIRTILSTMSNVALKLLPLLVTMLPVSATMLCYVAVVGNNVERNFYPFNSQIEHVQFVSTLSKRRNVIGHCMIVVNTGNIVTKNGNNFKATLDFVERTIFCCHFWQQSWTWLRQCCWSERGLRNSVFSYRYLRVVQKRHPQFSGSRCWILAYPYHTLCKCLKWTSLFVLRHVHHCPPLAYVTYPHPCGFFMDDPFLQLYTISRVPMHPWKYLNFSPKFKTLKVIEKRTGAWKSLNFITQVLESLWIDHNVNSL